MSDVNAIINYHDRREAERHGKAILDLTDSSRTTFILDPHRMPVRDARLAGPAPGLETCGYALLRRPTAATDLYDHRQVREIYYPEVAALMKELLGADEVLVFGEVLRSDDPTRLERGRRTDRPRDPARGGVAAGVHVDFNAAGVRDYVVDIVGEVRAAALLRRRFLNVNLWRPLRRVESWPLALCDAATVSAADFIPVETRAPVGPKAKPKDGYNVAFSPRHRWSYFPGMEPDEVLFFKIFDSRETGTRFTPHAAFADPTSPPDAAPRESFEIRTICFLPDDDAS